MKKPKKSGYLHHQIQVLSPVKVGMKLYEAKIVVQAFKYFALSRPL